MDERRQKVPIMGPRTYKYKTAEGGPLTSYTTPPTTYTQTTLSRGHAWPSAGRGKTDVGGNFSTAKIVSISMNDVAHYAPWYSFYRYEGPEFAAHPPTAIAAALAKVPPPSELTLMTKGTTAIARCLPTNPNVDVGTTIGELKSGLPKLIGKELFKSKLKDYRKVGSEYLNIEFGWKPIISDIQKISKSVIESEKMISQLRRDSGRNIRRRYTFPDEQVVTTQVDPYGLSYMPSGSNGYPYLHKSATGANLTIVTTVTTRTWFSGCFTYYLDLGESDLSKLSRSAAEARKLYGAELTPETVWNLMPWSWALDWEGNVGDVLHNVSRFSQDGLVMRYGYIMQETTCKIDYTLAQQGRFRTTPSTNLTFSVTACRKERRRASPFGFGFDMTALTGRQSAILGALGISRGPRHL